MTPHQRADLLAMRLVSVDIGNDISLSISDLVLCFVAELFVLLSLPLPIFIVPFLLALSSMP